MTAQSIRIGHPPRRPRRSRRLTLIALAVVPVVTGATLMLAQAVSQLAPYAGVDTGEVLPAWIGVAGLAALLATPRRRAPRPRTAGAPQRAHQPPLRLHARRAGRPSTPHASGV